MGRLLVKHIFSLVTCSDRDEILSDVDLFCENGIIREIGKNISAKVPDKDTEVIDGSRYILYPGLVNTHHHLYQTFSRNLKDAQNLELFDWLKYLYEIWKNLNEDTVYYSSMTGMAELLKTGCTTCLDHHYVFPEGTSGVSLLSQQFRAADELGMRFYATRGSMDLSVKDGGFPPDSVTQTVDEIMRDSEEVIDRFHDPAPFSMHRVALAPCSPFSVSRELLSETAVIARKKHVRLHTHVAETKDEENYTLQKYGVRPLAYMEEVGWTGPDVWYAHGIHFNSDELKKLAATGTGVAHCPASNMKLSSGVAKIPEMLKLGVPVGLAVDGSASNDGSSLLEEIRTCYLLHRLTWSKAAPSGYDILKLATRGSARLLGRDDIGSVEAGKAADFFMIDCNRIALAGALSDPADILGTVGYRSDVSYTVVNGKVVVKDGRLVNVDEEKLSENARKEVERYLSRSGLRG